MNCKLFTVRFVNLAVLNLVIPPPEQSPLIPVRSLALAVALPVWRKTPTPVSAVLCHNEDHSELGKPPKT